jgi:hypothetical protein
MQMASPSSTSCAIRGAKTRIIGSFKSSQCAPRPVFLRVCRHVTSKQHFRSKKIAPRSWWSCSATASGSPAARAGDTGAHPTAPPHDIFRAISAGECLVVSTVALCGAKLNSLTPLGSVASAAVVENYYVAHLACCLMQCNLVLQVSARPSRD